MFDCSSGAEIPVLPLVFYLYLKHISDYFLLDTILQHHEDFLIEYIVLFPAGCNSVCIKMF